jgi:hypothetical protein
MTIGIELMICWLNTLIFVKVHQLYKLAFYPLMLEVGQMLLDEYTEEREEYGE